MKKYKKIKYVHEGQFATEIDWNAINETLFLVSIPGMRKSIRDGMQDDLDECDREPGW